MAFDTLNNRGSVSLNYEKEDEYGAEEVQSEAMLEQNDQNAVISVQDESEPAGLEERESLGEGIQFAAEQINESQDVID